MVDDIMRDWQDDPDLYNFSHQFVSKEYRFAINFPAPPHKQPIEDIGVYYHATTPDGIFYSIAVVEPEETEDKNYIAHQIMDAITDTAEWKEYSGREITAAGTDFPTLTQTFISDDGSLLINTTFFSDKYMYSIQVQNVYPEYAVMRLSGFINTFKFI